MGATDAEILAREPADRRFGNYELLQEIARGGMGVVFKARHIPLNRTVALKMILAGQLAQDSDVKRFYAEAEAAAKLNHAGIVPIFEIGQHEGQHYFSMAFVEGDSVAKKLADGPLPPRDAAQLVKQVAVAVDYAHSQGIIHRDLKPANVLLDRLGQPKVTDFGLAKHTRGNSDLTATGQILGTPSYMPPEQAKGQHDQIGPRSDVYALGAILYCLVTGRPPFLAATPLETLTQVIAEPPASPRRLNRSIPRDLECVVLKCLEKLRSDRYPSAAALGEDLGRYLDDIPVRARPVSLIRKSWRWMRRHPKQVLIAVVVVATLNLSVFLFQRAYQRTTYSNYTLRVTYRALPRDDNQISDWLRKQRGVKSAGISREGTTVIFDVVLTEHAAHDIFASIMQQCAASGYEDRIGFVGGFGRYK